MQVRLPRPAIIAHRGASWDAPENTLAAFQLAVDQGADALEMDVKLSRDGHPVVIHDSSVDRTTNGIGKVASLNLHDLRQFDARGRFQDHFPLQRIPTLQEVLEIFGNSIVLNLELTNYHSWRDKLPEKVYSIVKTVNLEAMVHYSSFNPYALRQIHRLDPDASLGLLALQGLPGRCSRSRLARLIPHNALHPHFCDLTPALVKRTQENGRQVFAYTVNQRQDIVSTMELRVDGFFTDRPLLARKLRDNAAGLRPQRESSSTPQESTR